MMELAELVLHCKFTGKQCFQIKQNIQFQFPGQYLNYWLGSIIFWHEEHNKLCNYISLLIWSWDINMLTTWMSACAYVHNSFKLGNKQLQPYILKENILLSNNVKSSLHRELHMYVQLQHYSSVCTYYNIARIYFIATTLKLVESTGFCLPL